MKNTLRHALSVLAPLAWVAAGARCGDYLNVGPRHVDISMAQSVSQGSVVEGGLVSFTLTVQNLGPIAADSVTGGDTLPTGLTYLSDSASDGTTYSPSTGIWAIGTLGVGGVRTLKLTTTVNVGTRGATLTNAAGVLAFDTDTNLQNNIAYASVISLATQQSSGVAFTTQPGSAAAGAPFGAVVAVRDGQGNAIASYTDSVSVAISSGTGKSGASLSGTTKVAAVAGIATFSGLSIDSVATGYRLTASAPGLTSGTSASFSIVGPAGIGEPSDPGSGYLWADNFDRYASVLAMQNSQSEATYGTRTEANNSSSDVVEPGMALVTGRGGSGKALSATYPPGFVGSRTWLSPWGNQHLGSYSGTLVVQFYMRVSAGGSYRPIGGKYFEIWWASGASQRIQYAPSGGNDANGGLFSAVLGANPGGTVNRTPQPIGPYWNNINDGVSWVRVTLLFKPNTSSTYSHVSGDPSSNDVYTGTSSRDGRVAMWINGIKIMDYSQATVGVTPPGGANPWCYQSDVDMIPAGVKADHFQFPDYANSTASGFTIDHDDLKVWTIP